MMAVISFIQFLLLNLGCYSNDAAPRRDQNASSMPRFAALQILMRGVRAARVRTLLGRHEKPAASKESDLASAAAQMRS
jgi:hypothetical protein